MSARALWTLYARSTESELIDGPVESEAELAESFRDIARVNRQFGGTAIVRYALRKFRPQTVLDVGCGVADIPLTLRREAIAAGQDVTFTCLDTNAELLAIGQRRCAGDPAVRFVVGDGTRLPFADASFDVAMCNLALHHFAEPDAIQLMRELRRVATMAPVITDLRRSVATWLAAYAFSRLFSRNRLTRYDAPLSARRAYTCEEALALAARAGWRAPRVERLSMIRLLLFDEATV